MWRSSSFLKLQEQKGGSGELMALRDRRTSGDRLASQHLSTTGPRQQHAPKKKYCTNIALHVSHPRLRCWRPRKLSGGRAWGRRPVGEWEAELSKRVDISAGKDALTRRMKS